jgi:hypothetical protein
MQEKMHGRRVGLIFLPITLKVDLLLPGASSRALQSSLSLFQVAERNTSRFENL